MWLVAGLGNPGDDYSETRHNLGFMVIDSLAAQMSISLRQKAPLYMSGIGTIDGATALLLKPLTFMNRSGIALRDVIHRHDDIEDILIIHDDLDLAPGVLRIKKGGSSGGHNGVQSVIDLLGTEDFIRIRLGIGSSERMLPEKYVLRRFAKKEKPLIEEAISRAVEAIPLILKRGVSYAQNIFHAV